MRMKRVQQSEEQILISIIRAQPASQASSNPQTAERRQGSRPRPCMSAWKSLLIVGISAGL